MPGADHPLLVSVPLVDPVITRRVGLIRRKGRSLTPAAQQIYEFIAALPEQGVSVLLVDQNVRQCVRVSNHIYVLELGRNKVDGSVAQFGADQALRDLIAQWVDYKIDS